MKERVLPPPPFSKTSFMFFWLAREEKGKQAKRGNECGRLSVAPTKSIPDEVQTLIGYFDIIACVDYRKLFSLIGETVCLPTHFRRAKMHSPFE